MKEKFGEGFADDFFLDGYGWVVSMNAWLPFLEGAAQFCFYYAILETNLYGSKCRVERASEDEAVVRFDELAEFAVLRRATFTGKIPLEEYQRKYAYWMNDRAGAAGLKIEITFHGLGCIITLKRDSRKEG